MARRKDHSPEELRILIRENAETIIVSKGSKGLTARALAKKIGYTPGTIYNFFRDMDALITEVNYSTLKRLQVQCETAVASAPAGFEAVKALAYTYIDFARAHEPAWRTLFIEANRTSKRLPLPTRYRRCLSDLFQMIERVMKANLRISDLEAGQAARLLWASLHGITSLMLDGRLSLIGIESPYGLIEDLLKKYLRNHLRT